MAGLLGLEPGRLDQACPPHNLSFDVGREFRAGLARNVEALRLKLYFHAGIGVGGFGSVQQAFYQVGWCTGADHEAEPNVRREFGMTQLRKRRHIRQEPRLPGTSDCDRTELASLDMRQRRLHLGEPEQDMPGHQVGRLRAGSSRGHMDEIKAKTLVQLKAEEVGWRTNFVG